MSWQKGIEGASAECHRPQALIVAFQSAQIPAPGKRHCLAVKNCNGSISTA